MEIKIHRAVCRAEKSITWIDRNELHNYNVAQKQVYEHKNRYKTTCFHLPQILYMRCVAISKTFLFPHILTIHWGMSHALLVQIQWTLCHEQANPIWFFHICFWLHKETTILWPSKIHSDWREEEKTHSHDPIDYKLIWEYCVFKCMFSEWKYQSANFSIELYNKVTMAHSQKLIVSLFEINDPLNDKACFSFMWIETS